MKRKIVEKMLNRKTRIKKNKKRASTEGPVFEKTQVQYDISERITATETGGIGAIHNMANKQLRYHFKTYFVLFPYLTK